MRLRLAAQIEHRTSLPRGGERIGVEGDRDGANEGEHGEPECREYQTTIMIGGKPEKAYGRACRQPDGTWKVVG